MKQGDRKQNTNNELVLIVIILNDIVFGESIILLCSLWKVLLRFRGVTSQK